MILQIRDFPDEIGVALKIAAASARVPLREYVIAHLTAAVAQDAGKPTNKNKPAH